MINEDMENEKKLTKEYTAPVGCLRKKILLTTSAAPDQSPFSTSEKRPPIGIGFLISILRKAGHEVFFIDNYLKPTNFIESGYLQKNNIDYIGIYTNTICFRDTLRMLHKIQCLRKTGQWRGKIIVGGPHTTVAPGTIPEFVDYVVQGEGENAILDIIEGLATQRIVNYPRIEDLDALPMPAWDCFASLPYDWSVKFFDEKPVFTMNTSRGCPFRCTFCSVCSIWGKKYTYFSAERVVSDIEYLIKNYGVKGIYFREDNFTLHPERLKKFCSLMIEKGINLPWACESRVSTLNRQLVELMARAGARGFYFGVESGSQRILDLLNKDITVEQIKDAFKWCREFNIKAAASVIVGVPGETDLDRQMTNDLLLEIKPDTIWTNVFVGIPDSILYKSVIKDRTYEYIDDRGLVYLQGHNDRIKKYKQGIREALIPESKVNYNAADPKVSVLMSVYNSEKYIRQALQSIYNQTYQNFELVIIDDASTDGTADILLEMKDSRTFIHRNSENKGLTKSLNVGLKLCTGEYIARMDADDVSLDQRFEKQVRFLDENPMCHAVGSWCLRIDSNNKILQRWTHPSNYEEIQKSLLVKNSIYHGTAMMRKDSILQIGGYNENFQYSQDYDLWLRLSEKGQIRNLPECLYALRASPESISITKKQQQSEYAELARQQARERKADRESTAGCGTVVQKSDGLQSDANTAIEYFSKARDEFSKGNFSAAVGHINNYKSVLDYSKLPQVVNPAKEDKTPEISVVVVTYNRNDDLKKCLESLWSQNNTGCSFEVIVVDNGQSNVDIFKQYVNQYIKCPINFNLSEGRNIGAHFAKGQILVFLDDDALVGPNYLMSVKLAFDKFDIFGLRGRAYPKNSPDANKDVNIYNLGDSPFPSYCNQEGNSAFRRDIYLKMCGMDPLLFGHEGSELTYRIIKAYKQPNKVVYWPWTIIYHDFGSPEKAVEKKRLHQLSSDYLKFKHNTDIFVNRREIERYPLPTKQTVSKEQDFPVTKSPLTPVRFSGNIKPKVSIVIACHNSQEFLPQCIDSIRNQTMTEWELLLLDDASTDGTRDIMENYSRMDTRIKPSYFKDKQGPYVRRNFAIEKSGSEFIVIQDSDDIMYPSKLQLLYEEITKDSRLGVVGSFYRLFLDEFKGVEYTDSVELSLIHEQIMEKYQKDLYVCWHASAIIRKSMFDAVGLYDENPYGSDKFWLAKAAEYVLYTGEVTFANIPEYLTLKREHASSQQGVLPPIDPRSRRAMFQVYWEDKLAAIRDKFQKMPGLDVKAELRNCKCNDYIQKFSHLFEKSESQPLDDKILYKFIARGLMKFMKGKNVHCLIILDSVDKITCNVTNRFKNYDLLRGMVNFILDRKEESLRCLNREIQNHNNVAAKQFISDLFKNNSNMDVRQWCTENDMCYNLQMVDLEKTGDFKQHQTYAIEQNSQLPLVSVIMPAYNAEKYIEKSIESVLSQTFKNFELIIINDGSTDKTAGIISTFNDPRIKYFEQQNKGLPATHNEGIRKSSGQFVIKLDSDDLMTEDFIEKHLEAFSNNPDVDLVYCDDVLMDQDGKVERIINRREYSDRKLLIRDLFRAGFPVIPFRTCIRKTVFDKIGFFEETLKMAEDYDMMRRFVKQGLKMKHLSLPLYYRRLTDTSLSRSFSDEKAQSHFEVVRRFLDTFEPEELFPDVDWAKIRPELRQFQLKCLASSTFIGIGNNYVRTNVPSYIRTAYRQARSELDYCLKIAPNNSNILNMARQCEAVVSKYEK